MATSNEARGVASFLVSKLAADTSLVSLLGGSKIYVGLAPQGTRPPFVWISFLAGTDVNVLGWDARVMTRLLYSIRAVTSDTSEASADAIADRIDAALMGVKGTSDSGTLAILGVVREEIIDQEEFVDNVRYIYVGGRFRVLACAV